jgi:UDP-N-acetylmuramate dehydrogenase
MDQSNLQLKTISYYQTGGTCERIYSPASIPELSETMETIRREQIPFFLLGAGSNSLVTDDHWPGAVVIFSRMVAVAIDKLHVTVQAGLENTRFSEACYQAALKGASWMYWLPGQLGSTARMNARCYGGEISQIVESITAVTTEGEIKTYCGKEVFLGYKDTIFMVNNEVVAEIRFRLENGDPGQIRRHMDFCKTDREKKQQFLYPSCGCVFKNDYQVGIPSGLLLEKAGVRRLSGSRVEISPYHANFIFNKGATAREILETALVMRDITYEKFGVWLEFEMELLGIVPGDLKSRLFEKKEPAYKEQELAPLRAQFRQYLVS